MPRVASACEALTLYAFSEQNWARPDEEVDALMLLLRDFLLSERDEILDNGIRLNAVGNLGRLPGIVRAVLDPLRKESETQGADDADARAQLRRSRGDRGGRARARDGASRAASSAPRT